MVQLDIQLLGSFRAATKGAQLSGFDSDKVRTLMRNLVVESGCPAGVKNLPAYRGQISQGDSFARICAAPYLISVKLSRIVTSRERLQIYRGWEYPVPPLLVPDLHLP